MALTPKKFRLSSIFSFLDSRKQSDIDIYKTYMRFKEINGNKSHPNTIRDMIRATGEFMGLYEERLLLSIKPTGKGYQVETIIDTTVVKDKGN